MSVSDVNISTSLSFPPTEESKMDELVGRGDAPGWPFGLQPINTKLRFMEALLDPSFSHSPAAFSSLSSSPSFKDLNSNKSTIFDTTTTTVAATLGSLLGFHSDIAFQKTLHKLPPCCNTHCHDEEEEHRPSTWSPCSEELGNGGLCSCMRCVMAGAAQDYGGVNRSTDAPTTPTSLGQFLQAGRKLAQEHGLIDEKKVYLNVMYEEPEGFLPEPNPLFIESLIAHAQSAMIMQLPSIDDNPLNTQLLPETMTLRKQSGGVQELQHKKRRNIGCFSFFTSCIPNLLGRKRRRKAMLKDASRNPNDTHRPHVVIPLS